MHGCLLLWITILVEAIDSETIDRNTSPDYSVVTCNTFPCIINCNVVDSCRDTKIYCPVLTSTPISDRNCTLNINDENGAYGSEIFTGTSINIQINALASHALHAGKIHADSVIGSKLIIDSIGDYALANTVLYTPYGEGSEVTMKCGNDGDTVYICSNMEIYDHYTTNINLFSHAFSGFTNTIIMPNTNISTQNISNSTYRGSVTLFSSTQDNAFVDFKYYGTDHGNWMIHSQGHLGFHGAIIFADHSFITNDYYSIIVIGGGDTASISSLKLYAAQNNGNIILLGEAPRTFADSSTSYFQLICNSTLEGVVINSLQIMSTAASPFRFMRINATTNIKDVAIGATSVASSQFSIDPVYINLNCIVLNNVIVHIAGGYAAYSDLDLQIKKINGNLVMINDGDRGYGLYDCNVIIYEGVNGDVVLMDNTTTEGNAFRSADISIYGTVGGSVHVYGATGAAGTLSFNSVTFILQNVSNNVTFVETSVGGSSFSQTAYNIDFVGGYLMFYAMIDNGKQTFDVSTWNIGTVIGNVSFICNSFGAFSEGNININSTTAVNVMAVASGSFDFLSTDITINNAQYVLIYCNTLQQSFRNTNFDFGIGVGIVIVTIDDMIHSTGSGYTFLQSTINCRNCDEFYLKCDNYADCGSLTLKCPENNQRDKCKIECNANSLCNNINVYTTNGYCKDFIFNCMDIVSNTCKFENSLIRCIYNTANTQITYGQNTNTYCNMGKNVNDEWICENYLDSLCVHECTDEPTVYPTTYPTGLPTIPLSFNPTVLTNIPSVTPSMTPTNNPTISPSNNPTVDPSMSPIINPTKKDGGSGSVADTTSFDGTNANGERVQESNESFLEQNLILIIIMFTGLFLCCILLLLYFINRSRDNKKNTNVSDNTNEETQMIDMVRIGSISHVETININDENDILTLKEIFMNNKNEHMFQESFIFTLTQQSLQNIIMKQNKQILFGSIQLLYNNILKQIDIFVSQKQIDLFDLTYIDVMKDWNHLLHFHNIYDIQNSNIKCTKTSCQSNATQIKRRRNNSNKMNDFHQIYPYFNTFNDNTKQQIEIEQYYQVEFDLIHYRLFHQLSSKRRKSASKRRTDTISVTISGTTTDAESFVEQKEFGNDMNHMIEMALLSPNISQQFNIVEDIDEDIQKRYQTNIGSYGFGFDHQHHHLGPCRGNNCLKTELLNTNYISQQNWMSIFTKTIQKYKLIINNKNFNAKQFDDNYNICRQ
eukprot:177898_1